MSELGKHKAVLWGKLVTTAPFSTGCDACCFHLERAECDFREQREAGFTICGDSSEGKLMHIYVEAQPDPAPEAKPETERKHSHYFKSVAGLTHIDVYRVLSLFGVTDPCLSHAAKKILCAGERGSKDQAKDVQEAIDSLCRWMEMREEDAK